MSIESAGKFFDWIQGAKLSKALFVIVFVVYSFLLFEQYTCHYRLERIEKTTTVLKSLEMSALKDQVQSDLNLQTKRVFAPQAVTPWPLRVLCGGWFFLLISVVNYCQKEGLIKSLAFLFVGVAYGGCVALILDFCPTWYLCLAAGLIPVVWIALAFIDGLNQDTENYRNNLEHSWNSEDRGCE